MKRRIDGLVDALERGIVTSTTKDRLEALEAEKATLENGTVDPVMPVIHPNLAQLYRQKLAQLEQELADPRIAAEAKSLLRAMIKTIVVAPGKRRGEVELELHGELAAILAMTHSPTNKRRTPISRLQVSVVAGACNHLDLRLKNLLTAKLT